MAGAGTSCTHSASPNNGRAAMARAARCSKRRVMIIGNPPWDGRAASLFLCETQSDGTQLSHGTDSCGLRQIASNPHRRTLNTLHLRSRWRDDGGCGLLPVSYTHLRAHETRHDLVCRLLLEKKKKKKT